MPRRADPFITISQQPCAGGEAIGPMVVERLNEIDPDDRPWTFWDRNLVERVVNVHHLPKEVVTSMEDSGHSWLRDFVESIRVTEDPHWADEMKVYRRVAATVRALAAEGRVVMLGRGGMMITRNMPGGIHVRLVAPRSYRVAALEKEQGLKHDAASAKLKELEHNRIAFIKRYWPDATMDPEQFAVTINTEAVDTAKVVHMIGDLIGQPAMAG
jgi:cytidylate kinase